MELYYPWNIHVKEWEKVKEALKSPCKLPVPGVRCLARIAEQPHYCAQYAPTDPKHPWNEGTMFGFAKGAIKYMEVIYHVMLLWMHKL